MKIRDEDPRLVSLAVAMSKSKEDPIGTPSPGEASTPGTYFGAIRTLKYLVRKNCLTLHQIEALINLDGFKMLSPNKEEDAD